MQSSYLDAIQGTGEERTKLYLRYCEGVPQPVTLDCAKSFYRVGGFADKQVKAVRSLR